jgi:hypothetical protein
MKTSIAQNTTSQAFISEFAVLIKKMRLVRKLRRKQAAHFLPFDHKNLEKLENGRGNISTLWVNLVTAITLALPLAFEAMEPDIMKRKPRKPDSKILQGFIVFRIFFVSILISIGTIALFLWEYKVELHKNVPHALATSEAQTMAVTSLLFFQIFYLLNCRSLHVSFFKIENYFSYF